MFNQNKIRIKKNYHKQSPPDLKPLKHPELEPSGQDILKELHELIIESSGRNWSNLNNASLIKLYDYSINIWKLSQCCRNNSVAFW